MQPCGNHGDADKGIGGRSLWIIIALVVPPAAVAAEPRADLIAIYSRTKVELLPQQP